MNANDVPRMHISEPGDLAQLVPHLIGFRPEESLVVVVTVGERVHLTARVDLTEALPPGGAEDLLDRIWNRFPTAGAYLIAYPNDRPTGAVKIIIDFMTGERGQALLKQYGYLTVPDIEAAKKKINAGN